MEVIDCPSRTLDYHLATRRQSYVKVIYTVTKAVTVWSHTRIMSYRHNIQSYQTVQLDIKNIPLHVSVTPDNFTHSHMYADTESHMFSYTILSHMTVKPENTPVSRISFLHQTVPLEFDSHSYQICTSHNMITLDKNMRQSY